MRKFHASTPLTAVVDTNFTVAAIGDFQSDGKDDLFWHNNATGSNSTWIMNGSTIAVGVALPAVTDLNWKVAGSGDFQNDGKTDIVWRNDSTGANVLWYMNGVKNLSGSWTE